ncbi:hypothetical protein [Coprobacter tertius]|uniref:Uncharacterized protein n=1 Tax=Coprobacter tertius TaxID=2944915 RepID=A0ABT1MES2_9BACT|nr:hypothetical protein [Coprobacter tertius]MCP9611127.1 hypothetical protein [Coprobacter tertius]
MKDLKKWVFRTNEAGFINRENEKLENVLGIIFFTVIIIGILILGIFSFQEFTHASAI